jgi:DNA-binding NarL/FixJ family response regulator
MSSSGERIKMIDTLSDNGQPVPTIVVSRPGVMQQSLRSSLSACGGINVIASSGDGLTALGQVKRHRPGMLVIDSNLLNDEVESLLVAVKAEQPATRCLVLVRSCAREGQLLASGADAVAHRDVSAQQLQAVLRRLAHEAWDLQADDRGGRP